MKVSVSEDKSILVPPGSIIKTSYVGIDKVRLACRDRMSVGDVDRAYQRMIQNAPSQPWPCPIGHWDDKTFVIVDGRHTYVAMLMLGYEWVLVAWEESV